MAMETGLIRPNSFFLMRQSVALKARGFACSSGTIFTGGREQIV